MALACGGWGIEPWGAAFSAWGGTTCGGDQGGLGFVGSRYERVGKRHHYPEQPTERNVLFAVEGVAAKMRLGRPEIIAGHGVAVRFYASLRTEASVGAATPQPGRGEQVQLQGVRALCQCGRAEGSISMRYEMRAGLSVGESNVGVAKVRAVRNPTDEEFLMMIAKAAFDGLD